VHKQPDTGSLNLPMHMHYEKVFNFMITAEFFHRLIYCTGWMALA